MSRPTITSSPRTAQSAGSLRIAVVEDAGACGYLLKKTPSARLLDSVREAMNGGAPMTPEVARRAIGLFQRFQPPRRADYQLTPHEVRLLKMLVKGHNYTSAAAELGVSFSTIAFHMQNIYQKLQVHSKSEAVAKALLDGVGGLPPATVMVTGRGR